MVRELLASGEDVNEVNPWDWIPDGETECVLWSVVDVDRFYELTLSLSCVAEACGCM